MLSFLAAVGAAVATLSIPALPVLGGLRALRWRNVFLLAPVSIGLITAAAEVGGVLGIPWNAASPLVLGIVLGALARSAMHVSPPRSPEIRSEGVSGHRRARRWKVAAEVGGLGGGIVLVVSRQLWLMGSPLAISQTYDGIFHVNAIRRILDVGDASAWAVGGLVSLDNAPSYYPAGWHQVASLVAMVSRQEIPTSSNALMLVTAAVVWPLGAMALVRSCTSAGTMGVLAAGILSGAFAAFPFAPSSWGILLPFFLSMSLVPAGIALVAQAVGLVPLAQRLLSRQLVVLVPMVLLAIGAVHPQGFIAMLAVGAPILIWALAERWTRWRVARGPIRGTLAVTSMGMAVLFLAWEMWSQLRPSRSSASWVPNTDMGKALVRTLSFSATEHHGFWPLAIVFVVAALAVLTCTGSGWMVAAWSWVAIIAVQGQAGADPAFRYAVTGTWYSDTQRTAALPVVIGVPLLAVGIDAVARQLLERTGARATPLAPVAAVSVVVAVAASGCLSPGAVDAMRYYATQWQDPDLLSPDEHALLEQLPELVPADAVIAVNPLNGGALAYAIADRDVTPPFLAARRPDGSYLIDTDLQAIGEDPAVCDAAARLDVRYVLNFGDEELWGGYGNFPGVSAAARNPQASSEIARVGDATLAQLKPCVRSDGSTWG